MLRRHILCTIVRINPELAAVEPETVITGHGLAMHGPKMRSAVLALASNFGNIAVPEHGQYVDKPRPR